MTIRQLVFASTLALLVASPLRAADKPEDVGQVAAESWLVLVDAGKFDVSWDQAAQLFKAAITKPRWNQALTGVRSPLGKVVSRKVSSRQYSEKLPGAPDGKYVILQFETVFEKKASAVETVTSMLDPDGVWRVSGYFIR